MPFRNNAAVLRHNCKTHLCFDLFEGKAAVYRKYLALIVTDDKTLVVKAKSVFP